MYEITSFAVATTSIVHCPGEQVEELAVGTIVELSEVHICPDLNRVRGRLVGINGLISSKALDDEQEWAVPIRRWIGTF